MLEVLESRIAPAILLTPSTIAYTDVDGDEVKITFSKPLFKGSASEIAALLDQVFTFSTGQTSNDPFTPQQLHSIDLTDLPLKNGKSLAHGVSITISSQKIGAGDGFAHVGVIDGAGISLGAISVSGDLGKINAGDSATATGLKALTVHSLGKVSESQSGTPDLESVVLGTIGSIKVVTDIENASIHAENATSPSGKSLPGNIGKVLIGGVLRGTEDPLLASALKGSIRADGNIGSVVFKDLDPSSSEDHGIRGGLGGLSGSILAVEGRIGSVTFEVPAFIRGGSGEQSGTIVAAEIGKLQSKGGGRGFGLFGADGDRSATINAGSIGSIAMGPVVGGSGEGSGAVLVSGAIGSASFDAIAGGSGPESGRLEASSIKSLQITGFWSERVGDQFLSGSILGGSGNDSGVVDVSGSIKKLLVVRGITGWGQDAGGLTAGAIGNGEIGLPHKKFSSAYKPIAEGFVDVAGDVGSLTIAGLQGGESGGSGRLRVDGAIGSLTVRGSLIGGSGSYSGSVIAIGGIQKLTISRGGEVPAGEIYQALGGGIGHYSGTVLAGGLRQVTVIGEIFGGAGDKSGSLISTQGIGRVNLPLAYQITVHGGSGEQSGSIVSHGPIGVVNIAGSMEANHESGPQSASIIAFDLDTVDNTLVGSIGKVFVRSEMRGGAGDYSGQIAADGNIGSVYVGIMTGGAGQFSGSIASGLGTLEPGNVGQLDVQLRRFASGGDGAGGVWIEGSLKNGKIGRYHPRSGSTPMEGMVISVGDAIGQLKLTAIDGVTLLAGEIGTLTIDSKGYYDSVAQGPGPAVRDSLITASRITSLLVKGDVESSVIAVTGHLDDKPAIKTLMVKGNVEFSTFLAGYGANLTLLNPDVQVGAVIVTGNWVASSFSAGIAPGENGRFGDADDFALPWAPDIVSRIASLTIKGSITGTLASGDHFGFVAQEFGKVSIAGTKITPVSEVFLSADTTLRIPSVQVPTP